MLESPEQVEQSIRGLIESLDASDPNQPQASDRRLRERRPFRVDCTVACFPSGGVLATVPGATRNISFRGLAVVARAQVEVGHPIEVVVELPDSSPTHLAGVAAFCRPVTDGYHEIGLDLKEHGAVPIFCEDPLAAAASYPWLADALPPGAR